MELTGKVIQVLPEQRFNGKNGEVIKNSFVIEWADNGYMQKLCLEVVGEDKFEKMKNAVVVGHEVLVKFSVTSREWQDRWFTSCQCWYCAAIGGIQQHAQGTSEYAQANDQSHAAPVEQPAPSTANDLPF